MMNIMKLPMIEFVRYASRPGIRRSVCCLLAALCFLAAGESRAAELSVGTLFMRANSENQVVVSGAIEDEATIGVTIRLEIRPRPGNVGTVEFTPAQAAAVSRRGTIAIRHKEGRHAEVRINAESSVQVDVVQVGDPWPDQGTFSPFDTDRTNAPTLNGSVDDNGTFLPTAITYEGALSSFPIRASAGASGVWDVVLSTSHGDSSWEGVPTTMRHATIAVTPKACVSSADCNDDDACTLDRCEAGVCVHEIVDESCTAQQTRKRRGQTRRP